MYALRAAHALDFSECVTLLTYLSWNEILSRNLESFRNVAHWGSNSRNDADVLKIKEYIPICFLFERILYLSSQTALSSLSYRLYIWTIRFLYASRILQYWNYGEHLLLSKSFFIILVMLILTKIFINILLIIFQKGQASKAPKSKF